MTTLLVASIPVNGLFDKLTVNQRCTRTGRICDGYTLQLRPLNLVIEPAPASSTTSLGEQRALEFFYHNTSPQLISYFNRSFWKGSVLHFSLTEPCIRHAIAALGSLHEAQVLRTSTHDEAMSNALKLYNQAIHIAVQRPSTDASGSMPVLIISSIVFTCFEFLREDTDAAITHVKSGINLLKAAREKEGGTIQPWGHKYRSIEQDYLEGELAPILIAFHLTALNHDRFRANIGVLLNPLDKDGVIDFGDSFDTVHQARAGLMDVLCTSLDLARFADQRRMHPEKLSHKFGQFQQSHERWRVLFESMLEKRYGDWIKEERRAADHVHLMWYGLKSGFSAYFANNETAWDSHKEDFEEMLRLAESLMSDSPQNSVDAQRDLSSEVGFLASVHTIAWKCRWPLLRRRALDILLNAQRSLCTPDSRMHHAVYTRIMEIEEAALGLEPNAMVAEDLLPPEYARIHQYSGAPSASDEGDSYEITFLTKPNGPDGDWHHQTEILDLEANFDEKELYSPSPFPPPQPRDTRSNGATRRMLNILNSAAARSLP